MTMLASQITSLTVVYSIVYSGVNQRRHQSSASLAFVWEIHRWPVNFPHKWPVTWKMFPFDDVIMVFNKILSLPVRNNHWRFPNLIFITSELNHIQVRGPNYLKGMIAAEFGFSACHSITLHRKTTSKNNFIGNLSTPNLWLSTGLWL